MLGKFLIFVHLIAIGESQSCSSFFQYVYGYGGVEGSITYNPPVVSEHNLRVVLSVAAHLPSVSSNWPYWKNSQIFLHQSYVGTLSLYKSAQSAVEDLKAGLPLTYRIIFPITNPLPQVVEISHNGYQICTGQRGEKNYWKLPWVMF